jgi:uncharacterized membrane protein (UPF0127 family)
VRRAISLCLLSLLLAGCHTASDAGISERPPAQLRIRTARGPIVVYVEIARTAEERDRGLMGRSHLPADQGMVFLFDGPTTTRFWMKDTLIPLSIAFWDDRDRVVAILDMEPCEGEPCPTYGPDVPYVGAVEVNRGYFGEHGVEVGDEVQLVEGASP